MALTTIPVTSACDPCREIEKLCQIPNTFKVEKCNDLPIDPIQFAGTCLPIQITPYYQGSITFCCPTTCSSATSVSCDLVTCLSVTALTCVDNCVTIDIDTPVRCFPYDICNFVISADCFFDKISATGEPLVACLSASTESECATDYFLKTEICFDSFSSEELCIVEQDKCKRPSSEIKKLPRPVKNVVLSVTGSVSGIQLSGTSRPFDVYPQDIAICLKGENFNIAEEIIERMPCEAPFCDGIGSGPLARNDLFQQYLNAVLGGPISQNIHHGISQFFNNHKDVDRCGIDALIDLSQQMCIDVIDYNLQDAPTEIKRLLNIFSLNESVLFGQQKSFDLSTDTLGKPDNIGDQITEGELISEGERIWAIDFIEKDYHLIYVKALSGDTKYPIEELQDPLLDQVPRLCFYRHLNNPEERICNLLDYEKTKFDFNSSNFEDMGCLLFAQELTNVLCEHK